MIFGLASILRERRHVLNHRDGVRREDFTRRGMVLLPQVTQLEVAIYAFASSVTEAIIADMESAKYIYWAG